MKLSRKTTNNSVDEGKPKIRGVSLKNIKRNSENFKTNHFLITLRHNENVTKWTNQTSISKTSSESQSESQKSSKIQKIQRIYLINQVKRNSRKFLQKI